jgi:hypothetical protein
VSIGNQQQLQRFSQPLRNTGDVTDVDAPYSFQVWSNIFQKSIPGQEYKQYNNYLINWYKANKNKNTDTNVTLRLNYLILLRQIQIFFDKSEVENWYNNINLQNDKELLLAIPYFAKKIKEVALYYLQLRENIRKSRIKYNLVGTPIGINQQIQEHVLAKYTTKPDSLITVNPSNIKNIPALSSLQGTLNIQIEELYDTHSYYDHSPTVPVSAYYDLTLPEIENYFSSLGLELSTSSWVFNTGVFDPNNLELSSLDIELNDEQILQNIELSNQILTNFLGTNKFTYTSIVSNIDINVFDIEVGNGDNFFYWPVGTYKTKLATLPLYQPTALSATNLNTLGTAGSSIELSDTITVKTKLGTESAWLRKQVYEETPVTLKANFKPNIKTQFRYPYPGFGLTAEDIEWTGYSYETEPRYFFLNKDLKNLVNERYWSTSFGLTSVRPLFINSTTLIDNKAYASTEYALADKIRVWSEPPGYNDNSFTGEIKEAWLYQMSKTDISILSGGDSTIIWPFQRLDIPNLLEYPKYIPDPINRHCLPVPITNIPITYSTASNHISSADVIYKIKNYTDTKQNAIECAWLSGATYYYPQSKTYAVAQPSIKAVFKSGEFTKFLWQGPDTDCNDFLKTIKHEPTCQFLQSPDYTYRDYKKCTCKQVLFTPFGHPGENFTDYPHLADFIVQESAYKENFNLNDWRDSEGNTYESSEQFCWYKTLNNVGWGDGEWFSTAQNLNFKFILRNGQTYIYYRANFTDTSPITDRLPYYVLRMPYNNVNEELFTSSFDTVSSIEVPISLTATFIQNMDTNSYLLSTDDQNDFASFYFNITSTGEIQSDFAWVQGTRNSDGTWSSTGRPSNMVVYPGEHIIYSRQPTTYFYLTGEEIVDQIVNENRGSIWSNVDYLSIGDNQQFIVSYPSTTLKTPIPGTSISSQYPGADITDIVQIIQWTVKHDQSPGAAQVYRNTPILTIQPPLTGTYTVTVVAMTANPATGPVFNSPGNTFTVSTVLTTPPAGTTTVTVPSQPISTRTFTTASTGLYTFTNIPKITAIPSQTAVTLITGAQTPSPGFVLNTPLNGWDYNLSRYTTVGAFNTINGARPLWVKTSFAKDITTNYKSVEGWGSTSRLVDEHNLITLPDISDIELKIGNRVEYNRNYNTPLNWNQPLTQEVVVNKNVWSSINFGTTVSNLSDQLNNIQTTLASLPLTTVSPIILQSYVENEPVEIYYNALTPFTWSISVIPTTSLVEFDPLSAVKNIEAFTPWNNLITRYYPNILTIPTVQSLSTISDLRGYFTPSNLGVTQYLDRNFTFEPVLSSVELNKLYEDPNEFIAGRGLTKQDQTTPYKIISENNTWLKEPIISGPIAGNIKKNIFKKYQKFIPYQSLYESNPTTRLGLTTPDSLQTPWTGPTDSDWRDIQNFPKSFTGEINVENWSNAQLLKQTTLQIDDWVTDVYGNQYGLYKPIKSTLPYKRKTIPGEIWVRKTSQKVSTGAQYLSGIFDTFVGTALLNDLTGQGIQRIDVFFDTLYIQTTSCILFEKIIYDYNEDNIFSLADDSRQISLALPTTTDVSREFQNITTEVITITSQDATIAFLTGLAPVEQANIDVQEAGYLSLNGLYVWNPILQKYVINTSTLTLSSDQLTSVEVETPELSSITISVNLSTEFIDSLSSISLNPEFYILTDNFDSTVTIQYFQTIIKTEPLIIPTPIRAVYYTNNQWVMEDNSTQLTIPSSVTVSYDLSANFIDNLSSISLTPENYTLLEDLSGNVTISYFQFVSLVDQPIYYSDDNVPYPWLVTTWIANTANENTLPVPVVAQEVLVTEVSASVVEDVVVPFTYAKPGDTWFFPDEKIVIQSVAGVKNNNFIFELFEYNLNSLLLKKVFPYKQEDMDELSYLKELNIIETEQPLLTYTSEKKQYTFCLYCRKENLEDLLIELTINNYDNLELEKIVVYNGLPKHTLLEPPVIQHSLYLTLQYPTNFIFQLTADNFPKSFEPTNWPRWANIDQTGLISGRPPGVDEYALPFRVVNDIGPTYFALNIKVLEPVPISNVKLLANSFDSNGEEILKELVATSVLSLTSVSNTLSLAYNNETILFYGNEITYTNTETVVTSALDVFLQTG